MRIWANQLQQNLSQGLKPVYLVFGDEPLQKQETIDAIRQSARKKGFEERHSLTADASFNWNELFSEFNSLSLFSSQKLIELEIDKGKPGQLGAKALMELVPLFNPDTILLIHGGKIEANVAKTKWFKTLDGQGVYIPVYPMDANKFPRWLNERCQQAMVRLDREGINLMAEFFAGNLLAASQEIEKLAISYANQTITTEFLQSILLNQSRFTVFQLVDELLAGNMEQALNILVSLQQEGIEPNIVNWALTREVLQLFEMQSTIQSGVPMPQVMQQFKVWQNRQGLFTSALSRLSMKHLQSMIDDLHTMDIKLKSSSQFQPYADFCHICLSFKFADKLSDVPLSTV
jgi:DNA polymerase-3 subunit delta